MNGIGFANICDDQPVNGATLFGETRRLTSWIQPDSLNIQLVYKNLTQGQTSIKDKITSCWQFVKDIPYINFIRSDIKVEGRSYIQNDVWLDPDQCLRVKALNCMNKSNLLASLLLNALPQENVWVCLNNIVTNGIGGHAVCYIILNNEEYILETTNPNLTSPFMLAKRAEIYDSVIFFNNKSILKIERKELKEPFGTCCIRWMEDYINSNCCDEGWL